VTPETVVVFGGIGTVVLGLMYLPAHMALRRRAARVLAEHAPLPAAPDVAVLLQASERRAALMNFLSVDVDALSALRNNVVIFGPLLSAAIALFLSSH
jgi:hypothetical protein